MKLSPSVTLALALATGVAGAAVAQTSPTPAPSSTTPQAAAPTGSTGSTAAQPALGQAAPNYGAGGQTGSMNPPVAGQAQNSATDVRAAQQKLHELGLYNGPTDGLIDPDTMAAISRFQQQHGLPATSRLDQQTVDLLNGNRTMGAGSGQGATTAPMGAGGSTTGTPAAGAGSTTGTAPNR